MCCRRTMARAFGRQRRRRRRCRLQARQGFGDLERARPNTMTSRSAVYDVAMGGADDRQRRPPTTPTMQSSPSSSCGVHNNNVRRPPFAHIEQEAAEDSARLLRVQDELGEPLCELRSANATARSLRGKH